MLLLPLLLLLGLLLLLLLLLVVLGGVFVPWDRFMSVELWVCFVASLLGSGCEIRELMFLIHLALASASFLCSTAASSLSFMIAAVAFAAKELALKASLRF